MQQEVKELIGSIEGLKEDLKKKEDELATIRKKCNHVWPKEWLEKVGRDYRLMSGAVDPSCRRKEPEIIAIKYKLCQLCGEERTKK